MTPHDAPELLEAVAPSDVVAPSVAETVLGTSELATSAVVTLEPSTSPGGLSRWKRGPDYRLQSLDPAVLTDVALARRNRPRIASLNRRRVLKWLTGLAVAIGVLVGLRVTTIQPFAVPSSAMMPALHTGDRILVLKAHVGGPITAGNIVVFRPRRSASCAGRGINVQDVVDRVVGLPGETIWSARGQIYIDGRLLKERGWYNPRFGQVGSERIRRTLIPRGDYYVLADSRSHSCDSRSIGVVPRSSIVGKVLAVVLRNGLPYVHLF